MSCPCVEDHCTICRACSSKGHNPITVPLVVDLASPNLNPLNHAWLLCRTAAVASAFNGTGMLVVMGLYRVIFAVFPAFSLVADCLPRCGVVRCECSVCCGLSRSFQQLSYLYLVVASLSAALVLGGAGAAACTCCCWRHPRCQPFWHLRCARDYRCCRSCCLVDLAYLRATHPRACSVLHRCQWWLVRCFFAECVSVEHH
jgi:hypothetical protein